RDRGPDLSRGVLPVRRLAGPRQAAGLDAAPARTHQGDDARHRLDAHRLDALFPPGAWHRIDPRTPDYGVPVPDGPGHGPHGRESAHPMRQGESQTAAAY